MKQLNNWYDKFKRNKNFNNDNLTEKDIYKPIVRYPYNRLPKKYIRDEDNYFYLK